jgi:hypothetical protein
MRSHTGGLISFGQGGIACKSSKQKLNTKSSTEAELVGASNYLPNTIWVKMFMEAQGHKVHQNVLEQDNESAIKLSSRRMVEHPGDPGPGTKLYTILLLLDRARSEEIEIRHCPTYTCSPIFLRNLYRERSSDDSEAPFLDIVIQPNPRHRRCRPGWEVRQNHVLSRSFYLQ